MNPNWWKSLNQLADNGQIEDPIHGGSGRANAGSWKVFISGLFVCVFVCYTSLSVIEGYLYRSALSCTCYTAFWKSQLRFLCDYT